MKHQILSAALVLCLCASSLPTAQIKQESLLSEKNLLSEVSASELVTCDSTVPSPQEAYEAMIALKDQEEYKEGTTWTNDEPYSDSAGDYHWKGGTLNGVNILAVGCVAFAFILSDAAFGDLPARMYAAGEFTYSDLKAGDILRVNNDVHTVIILEVNEAGVVLAEGNISTGDHQGKVHWGRTMSAEEVMNNTSHYITRYPEDYIPPDDPGADEIIKNETFEGGLTWSLTKAGTMTISGSGAMPDFASAGDQPWSEFGSQIRKVVIGEGITGIGACAFWNCGVLSAEIPSSVTIIGNSAFRGSSLISVTIPSGVKTIGDSAFRECQGLSSVTVSEGVETIEQNAFRGCTKLASVSLPASIGEIGSGAFFDCEEMTSAVFASGTRQVKLGDNLFSRCYKLMSVTLPQSIDCIGEGMFQNCLMLSGVEIPQGAGSIGGSAFASSGVSVVVIPDSVTSIGIAAFSSCPLTDIYFTGTEAQWNTISKIGDTASAVSKATMHYEYSPSPTAAPTSEPDVTPAPEQTPVPEQTPAPVQTPAPEQTAAPVQTPAPEQTAAPVQTPAPEQTAAPVQTPAPEQTAAPVQTPTPEQTAAPAQTSTPEQTAAPAQTPAPVQTAAPAQTSAPTQTFVPQKTPVPEQTGAPASMVPFIDDAAGKEGWEAIKEETVNAFEGKQINIKMNGASIVPGDVLDSVKGQDITISFEMGSGITWCVNGRNVTEDSVQDVDLSVQVGTSVIPQDIVDNVAGDCQTTQLSLAHSGDFGYDAVLMINVGSENAGLYANLYYYNESAEALEFGTVGLINEDGVAELLFTHASDYVIVIAGNVMGEDNHEDSSGSSGESVAADDGNSQETKVQSSKDDESDRVIGEPDAAVQQEGNKLNFLWLVLIGAAGLAVVGVTAAVIYRKGKKKE